jgi:hypothetical protein
MTDILIKLDDIVKFCVEYDKLYGRYPESAWEGKALLGDLLDSLVERSIISRESYQEIVNRLDSEDVYDYDYTSEGEPI